MARFGCTAAILLLLVAACHAQIPNFPSLIGNNDLSKLASCSQALDHADLDAKSNACGDAMDATLTVCPPACATFWQAFPKECVDAYKTIWGSFGDTLTNLCGTQVGSQEDPSTPSSPSLAAKPSPSPSPAASSAAPTTASPAPSSPKVGAGSPTLAPAPAPGPATAPAGTPAPGGRKLLK